MIYSPDRIENEAAKVAGGVPRAVLWSDIPGGKPEEMRQKQMQPVFQAAIEELNSSCGTRRRKTLEGIQAELDARGLSWKRASDEVIIAHIGDCNFHVRRRSGLDVALRHDGAEHLVQRFHCTACEADIVDLMEAAVKVDCRSRQLLEQRRLEANKDRMISEVELPSVELIAGQYFQPRGIRYTLTHSGDQNILEIQIVNEVWMKKAVSPETLEEDLRFVPYLIKRPDRIKEDGRGFQIIHKWDWRSR